jgi:phosphohistidine swiveling domain-containing protein
MKSYGNKADNLQTLGEAGFEVPKFYKIDNSYSKKIQNPKTQKDLADNFKGWKNENNIKSVAVRSSNTSEDSKEHSFAGQFETVLNVSELKDFISSLIKVFGSKQKAGYVKESGQMYIVVQEFIEPDISGVSFTVNPATGASEIVINFVAGRGTKVVEGKEAQQCVYNRITKKVHFSNNSDTSSITKKMIDELVASCLKIETLFDYPQDIEWAIKDSKLYILQARPISTIKQLRLWDSSNIAESFPGIVLPLTFSIAKRGYELGYESQAYAGGKSWYDIEANQDLFNSMVGSFNGKMYYNLLSWYRYINLFPSSKDNQIFLDDQIATKGESIYQADPEFSYFYKLRYYARMLYRIFFFRREMRKFYDKFEKFETDLKHYSSFEDATFLMQRYRFIEQNIIPHFGRTLDNDFLVMTYHGWLKRKLQQWLPDHQFDQQNIIGSISGVLSAEQALSLYDLAELFKSDEKAHTYLNQQKFSQLEKHISGTELELAVKEYSDTFGHRFAEDQKIESINPTLEPHGVYKLLVPYIKMDIKQLKIRLSNANKNSLEIESSLKRRLTLRNRMLYSFLLRKLKLHLRYREQNRLLRGKVYGYMRELFPVMGRALVKEGLLKEWSDIYYLRIEELEYTMQGSLLGDNIQNIADSRKATYKSAHTFDMPTRFITTKIPSLESIPQEAKSNKQNVARKSMSGLISSPGTVEGRVVVLTDPKIPEEPFDILVAKHTDPGWTPLIALSRGVIVEHGGMLSHAAIVTRELGIPSIIGVEDISRILKTGMMVRINSQTSKVEIL